MQRLARQQEQEEFANEVAGPQNGNGNGVENGNGNGNNVEVGNSQPTLGGITLSQAVEIKSLADQYGGFDVRAFFLFGWFQCDTLRCLAVPEVNGEFLLNVITESVHKKLGRFVAVGNPESDMVDPNVAFPFF